MNSFIPRSPKTSRSAEFSSDGEDDEDSSSSPDDEKAERLFKVGIELEQSGKVYDALQYYRRAVQLVPDIEFRIYEISKRHVSKNLNNDDSNFNKHSLSNVPEIDPNKNQEDAENLEGVDLVQRFQSQLGSKLIKSSVNEKTLTTALHISDLPLEIIFYILKWTISNQLDMYSLEQIAATCKGLYLCARDEEIWKQACIKVWGVNTCTLQESHF
uniref:F-box only protein 9 n=1 Tax=Megaselia scalaris TaxID=36166 RepID=T1GCK8_MEGSC